MPRANRTRTPRRRAATGVQLAYRNYCGAAQIIFDTVQNNGSDSYQQYQSFHYTQNEPEPEPQPARPVVVPNTVTTATMLPGLILDNWATLLRRLYPFYLLPFLETGEFNAYAPIRLIHSLPSALDGEQAA